MAITTRKGSVNGTLYLYKRVPKRYAAVDVAGHEVLQTVPLDVAAAQFR